MDAKLFFGKVHIVEWLRPGDRRTGEELLDELQPLGVVSRPQVQAQLHRVSTRAEFVALLRTIEAEFRESSRLPVLHIETHGDYDGIGISEEEGFTFYELMEEVIPLNTVTGFRLIVMVSACLGMWGIKMLQPATRAACLALMGPNRNMQSDELARGFQTSYRTMFQVGNGNAAYKAMNDAVDPSKPTFGIVHCEMAFRMVYEQYLRERRTEESISKSVTWIFTRLSSQYFADHGTVLPPAVMASTRAMVRRYVEAHDEHFAEFRRRFFMIDICPENDERFPIAIEDCLPALPA